MQAPAATAEVFPEEGGGFGVVLASDCLYCHQAVAPLLDTALGMLADGGSEPDSAPPRPHSSLSAKGRLAHSHRCRVLVLAHISRWAVVEETLAAELERRIAAKGSLHRHAHAHTKPSASFGGNANLPVGGVSVDVFGAP